MLTVEVPVAVYFAYEDKELTEIYKDIETAVTSDQAGSAFEGIINIEIKTSITPSDCKFLSGNYRVLINCCQNFS